MDGIHGRMKRTKERKCKLKDRTIEITEYEQQRENRLKKNSSTLATCRIITTDVTFVEEENEGRAGKIIQKNYDQKLFQIFQETQTSDSRN